jgi:hypothetical protein
MSFLGLLILLIPGLFFIIRGIWMLNGGGKSWYFARHLYAGGVYAQIAMGVGFLWFAIAGFPRSQVISLILIYIGGGFAILAVIFNFVRPSFLKPAWLKWLEREHRDIYHLLEQDAHDMGLKTWERRMETRENLEEWVAEVRQKHGLEK